MDTSTRAAEPVLDATEPAPSADETEGIYAWSHADDDDDTVVFHRRSWKLPLAAALLAIAAVTTVGIVKVWPHHSTPGSPAAPAASPAVMPPTAAPAPLSTDDQFLASLRKAGLAPLGDPQVDFRAAHNVCGYITAGHTPRETVQYFSDENPQLSQQQLAVVVNLSQEYYCPGT